MGKVTYSIQGWTNCETKADFSKSGYTGTKARKVFNEMKNSGKYERIHLRIEEGFGCLSESIVMKIYEFGKCYIRTIEGFEEET